MLAILKALQSMETARANTIARKSCILPVSDNGTVRITEHNRKMYCLVLMSGHSQQIFCLHVLLLDLGDRLTEVFR